MLGKFEWKKFSEVDLSDSFFDFLKIDYPEFVEWFNRKSNEGEEALVFTDRNGVGAFLYLKDEEEAIELSNRVIPSCKRVKIGALRLAERQRSIRLKEGVIGVALWKWQEKRVDEIYITIFDTHQELIYILERFGFNCVGKNMRGEQVYIKYRYRLDYTDPYKSFPFINPDFGTAGIISITESFHDRLFPYSERMENTEQMEEITANNGITKVYIGAPFATMRYQEKQPVCIYRIYEGTTGEKYKSVITSYATITKITSICENYRYMVSFDDYIQLDGNRTVFTRDELKNIYNSGKTIVMIEMVYNGFFRKGHNVNEKSLNANGIFPMYPYNVDYRKDEFIEILEMGDVDVKNVIFN